MDRFSDLIWCVGHTDFFQVLFLHPHIGLYLVQPSRVSEWDLVPRRSVQVIRGGDIGHENVSAHHEGADETRRFDREGSFRCSIFNRKKDASKSEFDALTPHK